MFRNISVERFRGIRQLRIDGLSRINLFFGKNNCGKSSLLEAMFLLSGQSNPLLPLNINMFREYTNMQEDDLCLEFYGMKKDAPIIISADTTDGGRRLSIDTFSSYGNKVETNPDISNSISEDYRVKLISGLIMAGLGVEKDGKCIVAPLELSDLKGEAGAKTHDGMVILNKIESFLAEKKLPEQKREMIKEVLGLVFIYSKLYEVENDESKLKKVYKKVKDEILPFFNPKYHIDFTGRLFNVLNAWVKVPDGSQNDVVLTPRYVCELMTKLCQVNENSYVWDYATGSAGFLISAMKEMIKKANTIADPNIRNQKIMKIKAEQLLGVEKLPDIYMLAVLNMILMGDGSSNIIHKNSLTEFKGIYEMGEHNGEPFPADVFLLNPPYSAEGKGFVFVEKALNRMEKGRAAVLIQENAGSGNGLPYTKRILKNNTLLASIHMSDIFCGKAGVQTAIYVFDVGNPHNENKLVKFIDFSNDGYTRQNRKKSSANVNLKNTDHADERYKEIVDIVLGNKKDTHYFDNYVIEDTITLNGDDWTYNQHRKIDTTPTEQDFKKTVADYLSWKVSTILKEETGENF